MNSKEGGFKCDNGVYYRQRYSLNQHKASRHRNVTFDCNECDKSYTSKSWLKAHNKSHHEGVPAQKCDNCNYTCNSGNLTEHKRIYHDKIKLKCEKCTYQVFSSTSMRLHKILHENKKHYCEQCEFVTFSKAALQTHWRRRHSVKQFECDMCDYKSSYNLARHKTATLIS